MASSSSFLSEKMSVVSNSTEKILANEYVIAILSVIAVAYVSTFAPKLPSGIARSMDNIVVKWLMFFIIAYVTTRELAVSIITSLAVLALLMALQLYSKKESKEKMHGNLRNTLTSEPATVSIDANGTYTEAYPLGEDWTNKVPKRVMGSKDNQWPVYEDPAKMPEALSTCGWDGPQMSCGAVAPDNKYVSSSPSPMPSYNSVSPQPLHSSSVIASNEVDDDESEYDGIKGMSPMSSPMASLASV